jgi:hypothetical protein
LKGNKMRRKLTVRDDLGTILFVLVVIAALILALVG